MIRKLPKQFSYNTKKQFNLVVNEKLGSTQQFSKRGLHGKNSISQGCSSPSRCGTSGQRERVTYHNPFSQARKAALKIAKRAPTCQATGYETDVNDIVDESAQYAIADAGPWNRQKKLLQGRPDKIYFPEWIRRARSSLCGALRFRAPTSSRSALRNTPLAKPQPEILFIMTCACVTIPQLYMYRSFYVM